MAGASFEGSEQFYEATERCAKDLNDLIPGLGRRYPAEVILAAMAEHVGHAIRALRRNNLCDMRQAHQALELLEYTAFRPRTQPPTEPLP